MLRKIAIAAAVLPLIPSGGAHAQVPAPPAARPSSAACHADLSEPVMAAWDRMGGADGRLGCPVGSEGETATSPRGTQAREARFQGGVILRHMSGALAGKAFAVAACERTYIQYGGPSGWLGLPVTDALNTPDGQRQRFEGGALMFYRATGSCEDERATP